MRKTEIGQIFKSKKLVSAISVPLTATVISVREKLLFDFPVVIFVSYRVTVKKSSQRPQLKMTMKCFKCKLQEDDKKAFNSYNV